MKKLTFLKKALLTTPFIFYLHKDKIKTIFSETKLRFNYGCNKKIIHDSSSGKKT